MDRWRARLRQVPGILVLCGLLFGLWLLKLPGPTRVVCDRAAPDQVYCQATLPRPWAWLPQSGRPFQLQDVAIASELCDNTPRGGVRFCHRLTLLGTTQQITLPEIRTPLSGTALSDQFQRFISGEGSPQLTWSESAVAPPLRPLVLILLLAIASWGLWDLRWPPQPPSSLALDGALSRSDNPSRAVTDQQP